MILQPQCSHSGASSCALNAQPLKEVAEWTERYRKFWEKKFDSLELYLQELTAKEKTHGSKRRGK